MGEYHAPREMGWYKKQMGSSNATAPGNMPQRLNRENMEPDDVPTKELLEMKIEWRDKDDVKDHDKDYVSTIVQLLE